MSKKDVVWLGTPVKAAGTDFSSVYTSKIGGSAILFRELSDSSVFQCPKCKSNRAVSLLTQIYAPLEVYDRIIYVFLCATCSKEQSSFCFVLRSQNFNPSYVTVPSTVDDAEEVKEGALFEENGDWGDDENESSEKVNGEEYAVCNAPVGVNTTTTTTTNSTDKEEEDSNEKRKEKLNIDDVHTLEVPSTLASPGSKAEVEGFCYPCFALDVFEEPPKVKVKCATINDQLREVKQKYGDDVVETTTMDEDDEPLHEKRLRKYVERIGRVPSQCIRWAPNQEPLRSSVTPIAVPNCPQCGSVRRYELQLTSPIIYYLVKAKDEKKHPLHFGNVLVFTCSGNCNSKSYAQEYCVVEKEI
ncbi:pre-rRNA-processing protein TSR4 [Trypanosoma theileri]|uniref:Pre-rRNA-processing protein TSR4 n=1 Tax=Trypanosoma theileri TaxID=67003 RepID=A0A1X0PA07_9TRYP|nr:pre-rRNA-processing protein TSR4 [Trypanosoma theileri]ORC93764.1 pre-rRNA-processing protein TSR4 [Trypanosoma theileri]